MTEAKGPTTPFQKLAAALGATLRTEAREGGPAEHFQLERDGAIVDVSLSHGASVCLVLRAVESEGGPMSGGEGPTSARKNVLARARARLLYPTLSLRRVSSLDRFNTVFALRSEVRTGDADFDREVAAETELSGDVVAGALAAKEARAAVREILAAGFTVWFEERALRAELSALTDSHFTAATIEPVAQALATLVAHVPRVDPSGFTRRPEMGRPIMVTILVIGLLAAGALAPGTLDDSGVPLRPLPRPLLSIPTMVPGILLGTAAFVPAYLLLRWILKRKNASTDLPLVLALLMVMASLGVGVLDAGNRLLDDAPLAVHDVKVVARDTNKSRKSGAVTDWNIVVPSWRPSATQIELGIDGELFKTVRVGDVLRVTLHPGFFGWEWGAVVERTPGAPRGPEPAPAAPRGSAAKDEDTD